MAYKENKQIRIFSKIIGKQNEIRKHNQTSRFKVETLIKQKKQRDPSLVKELLS